MTGGRRGGEEHDGDLDEAGVGAWHIGGLDEATYEHMAGGGARHSSGLDEAANGE
jgi:hypothetical protein